MQLLSCEIMDLSVRKLTVTTGDQDHHHRLSSSSTPEKAAKKLSFSVESLLKSPSASPPPNAKFEGGSSLGNGLQFPISAACLNMGYPIRPIVTHPGPHGSVSVMQYMPSLYPHQVLLRPPLDFYGHGLPHHGLFPNHHSLATGATGKRKKSWTRAVFSHLQRKGLEKRFQIQKYITKPDRRQLAASLGLTDAQVKVWFQNRRMKWRHMESKERREHERQQQQQSSSSAAESNANNSSIASTSSSSIYVSPLHLRSPESSSMPKLSSAAILPPPTPITRNMMGAAAATELLFLHKNDSDEEDSDEEDEDDDEQRLVMNDDSNAEQEIQVD